jgi:hypothetical protein
MVCEIKNHVFPILVGHSQSMWSNVHSCAESQPLCRITINAHHNLAMLYKWHAIMLSQILVKGFQTRKCFFGQEYSNTRMPLPYKMIYTKIFLKLTPASKEFMSYVLRDNFIYNMQCNTNVVINNSDNFVLPCVWL